MDKRKIWEQYYNDNDENKKYTEEMMRDYRY